MKQLILFGCAISAIAASALVSQRVWRENGLRSLQARNEQRVQLVANAIKAEINRQDHLPIVLSLDRDVRDTLGRADPSGRGLALDHLNQKLARLSREADTRGIFVVTPTGTVVAGDDWDRPDTSVGSNVSEQPYFRAAMAADRSSYLGIEPSTGRARYYLAEAIRDTTLLGVAVVRIEFDALESAWEKAGERVLVANSDGIIFLASDPAYKYRRLGFLRPGLQAHGNEAARLRGVSVEDLSGDVLERRESDLIIRVTSPDPGIEYLAQAISLPEHGWTIHRLSTLGTVHEDERDGALIGGSISALILILVLYVAQRHRAFLAASKSGAELQRQVAERTRELRASNASLETEVEERRRTEARLRATQNELVQAGKLAALGQMSAAIAHEINQPLAAIRTFLASTKVFAERKDFVQVLHNLGLIAGLAERMASITGHLKTFARKSEPGRPEPIPVERAVDGALFLLGSQLKAAGVRIEKQLQGDLWVTGYAVQLEQVMLNLVSNALDAVVGLDDPWIGISARGSADTVFIAIADNGHGISPEQIDRIFDPFFTTKPLGKGLGLGLSISYGIVQEFGGQIRAANKLDGGFELTVELPRQLREIGHADQVIHA